MPYELECGHCGFQFVLDAWPLPRSVQCSVCGGRLTIAVPLAPPTAPELPKPAPEPPVEEEHEEDTEPERWRPRPATPWPTIHGALGTARTATDFGRVLYGLAMAFDLLVCPLANEVSATERMLTLSAVALAIPALLHVGVMCTVTQVPPAYGGNRARASVVLLALAMLAAGAVHNIVNARNLSDAAVNGLTTLAALLFVVAGFAVWLTFLVRLGTCMDSDALTTRARGVCAWFPFWVVLVASFLTCAMVGETAKAGPIAWAGRALLAATVLAGFHHYSALLRLAADVIDGRAADAS